MPSLRERTDRRALIERLFEEAGARQKSLTLDPSGMQTLMDYRWPGNVRELCNCLRSVVALAEPDGVIGPQDLAGHLEADHETTRVTVPGEPERAGPQSPDPKASSGRALTLSERTRLAIDQTLSESSGDVSLTARRLGVHRSTVYRHLARRQQSS